MILLDTDHVTLLQWGGIQASAIARRLEQDGLDVPATTIIAYEEHVRGWLGKISSAKTLTDEVRAHQKLKEQLLFYGTLDVIDFDEFAATEFQKLKHQRIRIGTMDLKIAAIALAHNALLLTKNTIDFSKVPELRIEDASR